MAAKRKSTGTKTKAQRKLGTCAKSCKGTGKRFHSCVKTCIKKK